MVTLPESTQRVANALSETSLDADILKMNVPTRTAEEVAEACDCNLAQIIKSMIFKEKKPDTLPSPISGKNRVDEAIAANVIGEPIVRPDAKFVHNITGFAIGDIPPIDHAQKLSTFMDEDLCKFETAQGAAGTPECVVEINVNCLREATSATLISTH